MKPMADRWNCKVYGTSDLVFWYKRKIKALSKGEGVLKFAICCLSGYIVEI